MYYRVYMTVPDLWLWLWRLYHQHMLPGLWLRHQHMHVALHTYMLALIRHYSPTERSLGVSGGARGWLA